MSATIAERLAEYADELTYDDLTEQTIEDAKDRLADSIATAYAGLDERPVRAVREYAQRSEGERNATIIGGGEGSLERATLANGSAIRYLDWNDTYLSLEPGHPSDNFGAVLTVADAYESSGEELLTATALAYEVQARLCDAASLRKNGWDHVNYGLASASLAAGKLMGLDREELANAVRLALNGHAAMRQARTGELTEWKGMAFGNADRNAVVSAELARAGINGPKPIFEGEFGVFNQLTGEFELDVDGFGGRGGDFKLPRTYIKRYPVEYHAQAAVNCALDMLEAHDFTWKDIEKIENDTYEAAVSIIADEEKWDPQTRETADHSMPYCIARAFIDGEMTIEQFDLDKVKADDVRELMDRIEIVEKDEYTEAYGESFPHRMVVQTADDTYECEMTYPRGHPDNPLTEEQLAGKFADGTRDHLTESERETALDALLSVDEMDDVSELLPIA
ncbi:MAG: MmgE/PrpD family protein [Halanaeroarchaeum sp.]